MSSGPAQNVSEHDPEKWAPVFRKDHAQSRIQSAIAIAIQPNPITLWALTSE
jgi:hypothetical protein